MPKIIPKITPEVLRAAGYCNFPERLKEYVTEGWQKVFEAGKADGFDSKRKKFFLNFYFYDFSDFPSHPASFGVHVEARMYRDDHTSWNLELLVENGATLEEVEAFYLDAYERMGCVPDIHNN
jgi:hypothetical protein